jgi:hypothetical protein
MSVQRWTLFGATALALALTPASAQQRISPGNETSGSLSQGDGTLQSGEFRDTYSVQARAGEQITVSLTSDQFDTYIMIRGPGDFVEDNDDAPGQGTNSQLTITAPAAGTYQVIATSFQAGETGDYRLRIESGAAANPVVQTRPPAGSRPSGVSVSQAIPRTQAVSGPALVVGRTVNGQLAATDAALPNGAYTDTFQIAGRSGQRLELQLTSNAVDPLLMIEGPGLSASNDDDTENGTTNSRLIVTLPQSGTYTVRATSYRPSETGNYQLTVRDAGSQPVASAANLQASANSISLGQIASGDLRQGDEALQSGEFADRFTFNGVAGQRVRISMVSPDIDSYLMLISPNGNQEENDDAAAGVTDSRLDAVLSEDGPYTIVATSYRPEESGSYSLSVYDLAREGTSLAASTSPSRPTGPTTGPALTTPANAIALTADRPANGQLAAGDTRLQSGEFTDVYTFQGRRGQRATISLTSTQFDPYLILRHPDGQQVDNDDGGDGSLNSQISLILPQDGLYQVTATSFQPGESGPYTLSLSFQETGVEVNRQQSGGRIFGVLVGVSDYGGTANNLEFTAEDASKLAQTLGQRGVLAPGSVVLTDREATVARVRQAFQQVAALASPEDTFLFFFSGHGTQNRGQVSSTEPDGYEEAIVLRDGEISDNEMNTWFGQVRARVSLLAIDACFSGGFARDVVSRPNVMGMFSSEEDLTSSVADKFRAGGYLSYFLRNGLAGDGDADGDAIITAGELSAYLRREFASEVTDVEATTTEGQRNYQFLVIDRGGVKIDDALVALR